MSSNNQKDTARTHKGIRDWLAAPQPRLGIVGLILLMVCSSLATPLALDMYTPAIPTMVDALSASESTVNLTLVGFFAAGAIGLLLFGTVSDKFGRKPVILAGSLVYMGACFACSCVSTVELLILFRVIAALGAGAAAAVGTAIIKDAIALEHREKLLALVQVIFVVGPVFSPIIGALLLQVTSWRGIFLALAIFGAFMAVLSILYRETLPADERTTDGVFRTIGHLGNVLRNKGFTMFMLVTSMLCIPFLAFVAVGSYIYEEIFGLSQLGYSVFFSITSIVSGTGPVFYFALSKLMNLRTLLTLTYVVSLAAGVALIAIGWVSPIVFCVLFSIFALFLSSMRPYSMNIMLNQQEDDTGAVSSMFNFTYTILGSIGMLLAVVPWPTFIIGVGAIMVIASLACLGLWMYMLKRPVAVKGLIEPRQ